MHMRIKYHFLLLKFSHKFQAAFPISFTSYTSTFPIARSLRLFSAYYRSRRSCSSLAYRSRSFRSSSLVLLSYSRAIISSVNLRMYSSSMGERPPLLLPLSKRYRWACWYCFMNYSCC
jgi:hypothetical protein